MSRWRRKWRAALRRAALFGSGALCLLPGSGDKSDYDKLVVEMYVSKALLDETADAAIIARLVGDAVGARAQAAVLQRMVDTRTA